MRYDVEVGFPIVQRPEKSVAHQSGAASGDERNWTRAEGTATPFSSFTVTSRLWDERAGGADEAAPRGRSCARDGVDRASTAENAATRIDLVIPNMTEDRLDTVSRIGGCWKGRRHLRRTIYDCRGDGKQEHKGHKVPASPRREMEDSHPFPNNARRMGAAVLK